jgi:hypothetical protein
MLRRRFACPSFFILLKIQTGLTKTTAARSAAYAARSLAVALPMCPEDDPDEFLHRTKRRYLVAKKSTRIAQAS